MAASPSSAKATERQIEARARRRIREADTDERDMVRSLERILSDLQLTIRSVVTDQASAPFAVALAEVERHVTLATSQMVLTVNDHLATSAAAGAGLVDELLQMLAAGSRLPAPDHQSILARLGRHARLLLTAGTDLVTMGTSSQLALLQGGRQDLPATLGSIGDQLRGSTVFGRTAERVTGGAVALTGEAFGEAQHTRALAHPDGRMLRKRWVSSHKTDARDTHADTEARYLPGANPGPIAFDDDFRVGRFRAPYPRGPGLPGSQKAHCGCRSIPVSAPPEQATPQPREAPTP